MGTAACGQFRQTLLLGSGQGLLRERCSIGQFQHGFQQNAAFELHRVQSRFCQFLLHRLHGGTGRIYHLSSSISSGMQGFSAAMAHSICDASGSRVVIRWICRPGHDRARVSQLLLLPAIRINS